MWAELAYGVDGAITDPAHCSLVRAYSKRARARSEACSQSLRMRSFRFRGGCGAGGVSARHCRGNASHIKRCAQDGNRDDRHQRCLSHSLAALSAAFEAQ